MRSALVFLATTAVLGFSFSSQAHAAPVDYQFSGVVTSVSTQLGSQFHAGDPLTGHFSLTLTVSEFDRAFYDITNFSANIGGQYPVLASGGSFHILNDFGGSLDAMSLEAGPVASNVAGHVPEYFTFNLLYHSQNDLTSTGLLPQFIFNSPLDRSNLRFDGNDSIEIHYALTSVARVPEPSTLVLGALGSLGLLSMIHRRARRQRTPRARGRSD